MQKPPLKSLTRSRAAAAPNMPSPRLHGLSFTLRTFCACFQLLLQEKVWFFFREWLSPSPEQHVTSANHLPPARGHEGFPGVSVVCSEQNMGMLQEKGTEKQSSAAARQEITEQDLEQLLADSDKLTPWESALNSWSRSA